MLDDQTGYYAARCHPCGWRGERHTFDRAGCRDAAADAREHLDITDALAPGRRHEGAIGGRGSAAYRAREALAWWQRPEDYALDREGKLYRLPYDATERSASLAFVNRR